MVQLALETQEIPLILTSFPQRTQMWIWNAHRVPKEGRRPAGEYTTNSFGPADLTPGFKISLVHLGIDLSTTLDKVQRCDRSMCDTLPQRSASVQSRCCPCAPRKQLDRQTCRQHRILENKARSGHSLLELLSWPWKSPSELHCSMRRLLSSCRRQHSMRRNASAFEGTRSLKQT